MSPIVRPVAALVALSLVVVVGACSSPDDQAPLVASVSTTTNPADAADLEPPVPPPPAGDIQRALEEAVAAKDFCALLGAMNLASPDPADANGTVAVYGALAAAARAARSFLPPELRAGWAVIVRATADGAEAVEASHGDLQDPDVQVAFTSTAMNHANQTLERYQLHHCAPTT